MKPFVYKQFTERHRPHIHPPGALLFVTYRLAGSIPKSVVHQYRARKKWLNEQIEKAHDSGSAEWREKADQFKRRWFLKFEDILHNSKSGPMWMEDKRVLAKVADSLHALDGNAFRLDAYSIMSNHVHAVFKPFLSETNLRERSDEEGHPIFVSEFPSLAKIMQLLNGRSAREANFVLLRTGQFWEHESFDHVIRAGKFGKTLAYVLNNPVKAGLVDHWLRWRGNYCRKELLVNVESRLG